MKSEQFIAIFMILLSIRVVLEPHPEQKGDILLAVGVAAFLYWAVISFVNDFFAWWSRRK